MPKIKELSNSQLHDYLDAYQAMLSTDASNSTYKRKVKCIETALHRRDLIGFDLGNEKTKVSFLKRFFSKFKRKK